WGDLSYPTISGVIYRRSTIRFSDIKRGTSNVYLVGEKYLNPDNYSNGQDAADNENMYVGYDNDIYPVTYLPPLQYPPGVSDPTAAGSTHTAGVNMAYCDAHVEFVSFDVDPAVPLVAGDRGGQ